MLIKKDVIKYMAQVGTVAVLTVMPIANGLAMTNSDDSDTEPVPRLQVAQSIDVNTANIEEDYPIIPDEPVIVEETSMVTSITANGAEVTTEVTIIEETTEVTTIVTTVETEVESIENNTRHYSFERIIYEPSGLSTNEFDKLIEFTLASKGKLNGSQMSKLGDELYQIETEYNINGLLILSIFTIESGYGHSSLALNQHNLGGFIGMRFGSSSECALYAGKLLSTKYINMGYTSISAISKKYCPPTPDSWTNDVTWAFNMWIDNAETLYT